MRLNPDPFKKILNGDKDIELRLYDKKRRGLSIGDLVEFTNLENGNVLIKEIVNILVAQKFSEILINDHLKERAGYTPNQKIDELMHQSYLPAEIDEKGVVAIFLK